MKRRGDRGQPWRTPRRWKYCTGVCPLIMGASSGVEYSRVIMSMAAVEKPLCSRTWNSSRCGTELKALLKSM